MNAPVTHDLTPCEVLTAVLSLEMDRGEIEDSCAIGGADLFAADQVETLATANKVSTEALALFVVKLAAYVVASVPIRWPWGWEDTMESLDAGAALDPRPTKLLAMAEACIETRTEEQRGHAISLFDAAWFMVDPDERREGPEFTRWEVAIIGARVGAAVEAATDRRACLKAIAEIVQRTAISYADTEARRRVISDLLAWVSHDLTDRLDEMIALTEDEPFEAPCRCGVKS